MGRIQPHRAELEIAHKLLRATLPLDDMLKSPALCICLKNVAARHMQRRAKLDVKKLQANDVD